MTENTNNGILNGIMDADTMFENWLASGSERLKEDFLYYYGTDPRTQYIRAKDDSILAFRKEAYASYEEMINYYLVGPRFGKYHDNEMALLKNHMQYANQREIVENTRREKEKKRKKAGNTAVAIAVVVIVVSNLLALLIYFLLVRGAFSMMLDILY